MSVIEHSHSLFFNSNPASGAVSLGNEGDKFMVQLFNPMSIPKECLYATVEVVSAKVWNTSPNIHEMYKNNELYFSYSGSDYNITFPNGLYGIEELNEYLTIKFDEMGLPINEEQANGNITKILFEIVENESIQKVGIRMNYAGISIDFTQNNTIREIVGFNSRVLITPVDINGNSNPGSQEIGDNFAQFNRIDNYYIKSNLVSAGIPQNRVGTGILTEIPINVRPGSLINYAPNNPLRIDASELIGLHKQNLEFTLVDQLERPVSTGGNFWSFTMTIRYWIKH